jgi:hypothetical protein
MAERVRRQPDNLNGREGATSSSRRTPGEMARLIGMSTDEVQASRSRSRATSRSRITSSSC